MARLDVTRSLQGSGIGDQRELARISNEIYQDTYVEQISLLSLEPMSLPAVADDVKEDDTRDVSFC